MILTDGDILHEKMMNRIVISPFNESQLKNTMYDVTLGPYYYTFNENHYKDYWSPHDQKSIEKYWTLCKAEPKNEAHNNLKLNNIDEKDQIIILYPGELILGHTNEFIGTTKDSKITTQMHSRSTMGRCGLRFCACAGLGDIGYFNRWTMEIENVSKMPIVLKVGTRVASITFTYVSSDPKDIYPERGSYTQNCDIDNLVKQWKPEMMIPKETN